MGKKKILLKHLKVRYFQRTKKMIKKFKIIFQMEILLKIKRMAIWKLLNKNKI
jgi:hypothetical protein